MDEVPTPNHSALYNTLLLFRDRAQYAPHNQMPIKESSAASPMSKQKPGIRTYCPVQLEVREALSLLGTDRLVLAIHDQSFPSAAEEEIGRGSPYTEGGTRFIHFIRSLGFTGIQFGPQGKTSQGNPSPYDGTLFSKSELSISLKALVENPEWCGLLDMATVTEIVAACPASSPQKKGAFDYKYAWHAQQAALRKAFKKFMNSEREVPDLWNSFNEWTEAQRALGEDWLFRDAIFEVLTIEYGTDDWRRWSLLDQRLFDPAPGDEAASQARLSDLREQQGDEIRFYFFCQFVVHTQHAALQKFAADIGLRFYGDLQIGYSSCDTWSCRHLFLPGYLMGAPPSRTNPDGQPWGFPVLDPRKYYADGKSSNSNDGDEPLGPALSQFKSRIQKMLKEFDGIRLDHPHGLVCPWVYNSTDSNALHAVQNGARLFASPDVEGHTNLANFAIAQKEQLNPDKDTPRYADNWVVELRDEQVARFAVLIDLVIDVMSRQGSPASDVVCEVLSTCPYPLRRVMERHSLGRFRVTQKASLTNTDDGYRSENAKPSDWIMVGNHDTKPAWRIVNDWKKSGEIEARAKYMAERLEPDAEKRADFAAELIRNPNRLCEAMFADLFASPARNVSIFFPDLLGMTDVYNEPGTISDTNWSLRVPHDYESLYHERLSAGAAISIPRALIMALHARYPEPTAEVTDLIERLKAVPA
ncbi:MAG: 4-alpha-glucanotransferase [Candidatus Melainabacteria bacterium]|nr:MAG: 4-alpha-glucanotransferase [Candidatus Melainabacteria bacterium]